MKSQVTIRLLGGLTNQMFHRAYGLALEHRGYEVKYSTSFLVPGTYQEYSLEEFGDIPHGKEYEQLYLEGSFAFNPAHLNPSNATTLYGYWQNEKYFKDIELKIRNTFRFKTKMSQYANEILAEILNSDSVFVHVRRKYYVDLPHYHGTLTPEWYRAALSLIPNTNVFIFSDDPEWCKQNFDYKLVEGTTKYEDLQLMAACKSAVIANSTFGWWGAWLGEGYSNRKVIAPKRWFTDKIANETQIVPERWISL